MASSEHNVSENRASGLFGETGMVTVQQHIMDQQAYHPTASGEFSWLLSGITQATKIIAAKVRRAGLADILGSMGMSNVQGEDVQKLDTFANELLIKCLWGAPIRACSMSMGSNRHPRPSPTIGSIKLSNSSSSHKPCRA